MTGQGTTKLLPLATNTLKSALLMPVSSPPRRICTMLFGTCFSETMALRTAVCARARNLGTARLATLERRGSRWKRRKGRCSVVDFCDCIYKGTEHPHEHCPSKLRGSTCVHECVKAQAKAIAAKDGGIKYLRALVKALADGLNHELETGCIRCMEAHSSTKCPHAACDRHENRALVEKAREVLNG